MLTMSPLGPRTERDPEPGRARPDQEALLRAVSVNRMMDYGAALAESTALRERVGLGAEWMDTAAELADQRADSAAGCVREGLHGLAAVELRAASSLRFIGQLAYEADCEDKRTAYRSAVQDYETALHLDGAPTRRIEADGGAVTGWLTTPPGARPAPTILVWGGTSGWGPVYHSMGRRVLDAGFAVVLLELPGQGVPRLEHGRTLGPDFVKHVSAVIDVVLDDSRCGEWIGVAGHSMGATLAAHVSALEPRISACIVNGGVADPAAVVRRHPRQSALWASMLGTVGDAQLQERLEQLDVRSLERQVECPLLVVHGGADPLVDHDDLDAFRGASRSEGDHTLVVFPDGEHCVYNRPHERDALYTAWLRSLLTRD